MDRLKYLNYILKNYGTGAFTIDDFFTSIVSKNPCLDKSRNNIRLIIHRLYKDDLLCKPSRGTYCLAVGNMSSKQNLDVPPLPRSSNILKKIHEKYPILPKDKKSYAIFVLPNNRHILYINSAFDNRKQTIIISYGSNTYEVTLINPIIKVNASNVVAVSLIELSNYISEKNISISPNQFLDCFCTFWGEKRKIRKVNKIYYSSKLIMYLTEQSSILNNSAHKDALEEEYRDLNAETLLSGKYIESKKVILKELTTIPQEPYDVFSHHYCDFSALHSVIKSYYRAAKDKRFFELSFSKSYLSKLYPSKYLDPNFKLQEVSNPDTLTDDKPYVFYLERRMQ